MKPSLKPARPKSLLMPQSTCVRLGSGIWSCFEMIFTVCKFYLCRRQTENTGKGGRGVEHWESVDLIGDKVNLGILSIKDEINCETPGASYKLPSVRLSIVAGRRLQEDCWGCSRWTPSPFHHSFSVSQSRLREAVGKVRSLLPNASPPLLLTFSRSCLQKTWRRGNDGKEWSHHPPCIGGSGHNDEVTRVRDNPGKSL